MGAEMKPGHVIPDDVWKYDEMGWDPERPHPPKRPRESVAWMWGLVIGIALVVGAVVLAVM